MTLRVVLLLMLVLGAAIGFEAGAYITMCQWGRCW
jgi:hypothetical protein